jgi:hypothetical protein
MSDVSVKALDLWKASGVRAIVEHLEGIAPLEVSLGRLAQVGVSVATHRKHLGHRTHEPGRLEARDLGAELLAGQPPQRWKGFAVVEAWLSFDDLRKSAAAASRDAPGAAWWAAELFGNGVEFFVQRRFLPSP